MITKKKRKPTRKQQLKKFDELWSYLVKVRAGFRCEYCGKTKYLNSHHIFTRNNYSTRFDLDNGICLCAGHHTFNPHFSAHKTPMEFTQRIISKRGQKRYDSLRLKANQIWNKDYDRIELYLHNKQQLLCGEYITKTKELENKKQ